MPTVKESMIAAAKKKQVELQERLEARPSNDTTRKGLIALEHNIKVAEDLPESAFPKNWKPYAGSVDSALYAVVKPTGKGLAMKDVQL